MTNDEHRLERIRQLPSAYKTGDVLLMRVVGIVLIAGCVIAKAWIFLPFAIAYMFRDWCAGWLYDNTTPEQRALIRFAQFRLIGSAVASLYVVALYQAGFFTVLLIFLIAWLDVFFQLWVQRQISHPPTNLPALPSSATQAVAKRTDDRRIVRP